MRGLPWLLIAALASGCGRSVPDAAPESPLLASAAPSALPLDIPEVPAQAFDVPAASRLVALSLECADKEFPNKPDRVLSGDQDLRPPRDTNPAFFGCFDWHSAVHGHWAMLRVLSRHPALPEAAAIRGLLSRHLTRPRMDKEVAFFSADANKLVERPYGWGWLMRLAAELHASKLPEAHEWNEAVRPLAVLLSARLQDYLTRLTVPVRAGTHANTAFSLVHALDYARITGDSALASAIDQSARRFYLADTNCPTAYEPSGEDFVSPCLAEADLMRRVLEPRQFAGWLDAFLPPLASPEFRTLVRPVEVKDRHDPRIGHLIGLSLQRAWAMQGIGKALPPGDARILPLRRIAALHRNEALRQVFDSGYGGSHWLASFAIYLATSDDT